MQTQSIGDGKILQANLRISKYMYSSSNSDADVAPAASAARPRFILCPSFVLRPCLFRERLFLLCLNTFEYVRLHPNTLEYIRIPSIRKRNLHVMTHCVSNLSEGKKPAEVFIIQLSQGQKDRI